LPLRCGIDFCFWMRQARQRSEGAGMADDLKYDVFLSHSAKDMAVVRPLAERLQVAVRQHLKVWFDEWGIKPGDNIPARIEEGREQSTFGLRICAARHVGECVRLGLGAVGGRHVPV
jgi:hypothetical protein